jgi:hypothetical protein
MQFFLYEILARIVAAYLCFHYGRKVWVGLVERKIAYVNDDVVDWLLIDWSKVIAHRETTPVRYWIQIVLQTITVIGCLGVAILGWWHPNT